MPIFSRRRLAITISIFFLFLARVSCECQPGEEGCLYLGADPWITRYVEVTSPNAIVPLPVMP